MINVYCGLQGVILMLGSLPVVPHYLIPWTVGCVCHLSSFVVLDEYHLPTVPWVKETFPWIVMQIGAQAPSVRTSLVGLQQPHHANLPPPLLENPEDPRASSPQPPGVVCFRGLSLCKEVHVILLHIQLQPIRV